MLSKNSQSTLLLTSYFSKPIKGEVKPLTPTEWGRFALWLRSQHKTPTDLLMQNPTVILEGWDDKKITQERIITLLERGNAMALAMEKWTRAGIWVLSRSDQEYPHLLKQRLKENSPPLLFGCGNKKLLNQGGIAVVGSRKITADDRAFTTDFAKKAASMGQSIISGGAKGVDETAMLGALEAGGNAIGMMANSLLPASVSQKWRDALMDNRLVLISPFYPEAGFNVGNAMARNKYIYGLSNSALVVFSAKKGGTWTGALENIKKAWVPLWVKSTDDPHAGNNDLVGLGGLCCDSSVDTINIDALANPTMHITQSNTEQVKTMSCSNNLSDKKPLNNQTFEVQVSETTIDFYQLFLKELERLTQENALKITDISQKMQLQEAQIKYWIKIAIEEQNVNKLTNPIRYKVVNNTDESQMCLKLG